MRTTAMVFWGLVAVLGGVSVSCKEAEPADSSESAPATNSTAAEPAVAEEPVYYATKGVVQEVLADRNRVKIAHEEIPGYMDAMIMTFKVAEGESLDGLAAGDAVEFRMVVTKTDGWIDQLIKVEAPVDAVPPMGPGFRRVRDVDPLNVGDLVPEYHFTNELGNAVSLSQFRGKAVALTFLYTRCAFPTFCPRMAGNFAAAQEKLKALEGGPENWQLLTVTFDPEFDTPSVLAGYARGFGYDTNHWSFLTGGLIDITAIAEQFGMLFWKPDPSKPASIDHNLRTVVIDTEGRVRKVLPENEWKVDDLVKEIVAAAKTDV